MANILLTGASGYLGGSILAQLHNSGADRIELPAHGTIYALVRSDIQAQAVQDYGAEPAAFDPSNEAAIQSFIVGNEVSIVIWFIDVVNVDRQILFIRALAKLRQQTGQDVHFLQTSGAKIFSDLAGAPTDRPLLDIDPGLYEIQKKQQDQAPYQAFQKVDAASGLNSYKKMHRRMVRINKVSQAVATNNTIISLAEEFDVKSYIIAPCIVYGKGLGFGNLISAQTVAIVRAAKEAKRVYRVDDNSPTWPVCHIRDNTDLYIRLLAAILSESRNPGHENEVTICLRRVA
ncbi:uncharacterized protein TrAtP1_012670 [Trichoderma atroviride]|uniref:uncharacterized protein n=1 Tax=Hypocrea atroviridis TaxID=63577 RepID=UPI0033296871|nr:hypothetical protein TrAtP1_012670 [Trichoderma atroviride]